MTETLFIQADLLRTFSSKVFQRLGIPRDQAEDAADVLVWANLHGIDTHGVRNLKQYYVAQLEEGLIRPDAKIEIEHETPISARVNAGGGLGLAAACWGMRRAIAKAQESGSGFVSMNTSNHLGASGYFARMAVEHDMIGVSMTGYFLPQDAERGLLPTFGITPMLSTNPLSVSFPTEEEPPFLLDMATSIVPYNRIQMMREAGKPIPLGWGLDQNHQPTTDPDALYYLLPLGGPRELGGHKGYGLALMVGIFCAVLSGGWFDPAAMMKDESAPEAHGHFFQSDDPSKTDTGYVQRADAHFFGAIRLDLFRSAQDFKRGLDAMIRTIHSFPAEPGKEGVLYPGEIEYDTSQRRQREGIPIPGPIAEDLRALSKKYALPLALGSRS